MTHFDILQLDRHRLPNPLKPKPKDQEELICRMSAMDAIETLVKYCLESPDTEPGNLGGAYAFRQLGAFSVGVCFEDAPGVEDDSETWINRVRVNRGRNPFHDRTAGFEVKLPYGASNDEDTPYLSEDMTLSVLYPYEFRGRLVCDMPDLLYVDVAQVDRQIEASGHNHPDFTFVDAMNEVFEYEKLQLAETALKNFPASVMLADLQTGLLIS